MKGTMKDSRKASGISYGWGDIAIDFALLLALPVAIIAFQYSANYPAQWMALDLSSPMTIAIYGRLIGHISTTHLTANVIWLVITGLIFYGYALWTVEIQTYRIVIVACLLGTPVMTATSLWVLYSSMGKLPLIAGASDIPLAIFGATISLYLRGAWDEIRTASVVEIGSVFLGPGLVVGITVWTGDFWLNLSILVLLSLFVWSLARRRNYYRRIFVQSATLEPFDIWYGMYLSALLVSITVSTLQISPGPVSQIAHLLGFLTGMTIGGVV
jgi:hypothetical protein